MSEVDLNDIEDETIADLVLACQRYKPILDGLLGDMRKLAAKRPEMPLSPARVRTINRLLKILQYCCREEPERDFLDLLRLGQAKVSEAVLVMGPYESVFTEANRRTRLLIG